MKNKCPICNYNDLYDPPYDSRGYGSCEICPCCGFQFGYDDYPNKEEAQKEWRDKWINYGYTWFSKIRIPSNGWNPKSK